MIWEKFTIHKILGSFRRENLRDYFDELELIHVLPKLLQYVYSRAECENVVWVVNEEMKRLQDSQSNAAPYESEQLLYRELKLQSIKPISEQTLGAHFATLATQSQAVPSLVIEGQGYMLVPVQDPKGQQVMGYLFLMGLRPERMERAKRRLMRDLSLMAKHLAFSLQHWQAQRQSFLDDLTALYNQKYMSEVLENEIHRAQRDHNKFSVLFMDVDYFKAVNDTRGHWVGSKLLIEVGRLLRAQIRRSDYAFRYGGDEFVIVLPSTDSVQARLAAERIRGIVERTEFLIDGEPVKLTLSIGLATYPDHAKTYKDIIKMADEAMYCGKNKSRNVVFVAS